MHPVEAMLIRHVLNGRFPPIPDVAMQRSNLLHHGRGIEISSLLGAII
jgi:hypothetical protein